MHGSRLPDNNNTKQKMSAVANASTAWRKAGLSYSSFLAIAARTVRESLKKELQTPAVMGRGKTDAAYTKYEKGSPKSDPIPLQE